MVSSQNTIIAHAANSVAVTFAFDFLVQRSADLTVALLNADASEAAPISYSVSGLGLNTGGTITFVSAPATGITVVIYRKSFKDQEKDYVPNDDFPAETHETALDRSILLHQEAQRDIGTALRFPLSENTPINAMTKALRSGKMIEFDSNGNITFVTKQSIVDAGAAASTASAASALASANSASSSAATALTYRNEASSSANDAAASENAAGISADEAAASAASINPANLALKNMTNAALATESSRGAVELASSADLTNLLRFDAWGDSLTLGAGQTPWTTPFASSTGYPITNDGVGGETSSQIKTRFDAASARHGYNTVFWVGRNDFSNPTLVKANIAAMVASLGHTRYLILSVINQSTASEYSGGANYAIIAQLNADLAALYGTRFLDIRAYLIANGLSALGLSPTAQDTLDISRDVIPEQLRIDAVHLTSAAYTLVAAQVATKLSIFESGDAIVTSVGAVKRFLSSPTAIGNTTPGTGAFTTATVTTVLSSQAVFTEITSVQPVVVKTSATQQAGGGLEFQNSSGTTKWRVGTHGMVSGTEGNTLEFGYFDGTDYARGLRLRNDGFIEFIGTGTARFTYGAGSPEGVIDAPAGSIYFNTTATSDGGGTFFRKTTAGGSPFGWRTNQNKIQVANVSTGFTVTISNVFEDTTLYINAGATMAAGTINLPGNSDVGQTAYISTNQTITALTIQNATTINGNVTTLAAGACVAFRCVTTSPKVWTRIA